MIMMIISMIIIIITTTTTTTIGIASVFTNMNSIVTPRYNLQSCTSKAIGRQGMGSFCKDYIYIYI